ncbi:MAG: adenosylmethionine--8-amino-7-oxononanoate transaminase [Chthoniobacteraceae bacterium]
MSEPQRLTRETIAADQAHTWHPFTPMEAWCAPEHEPLVLVSGEGALLRDSEGREYIDGNSSIWTNLHGHRHPKIDAAIRAQLDRVAHTSFLGFTHPLAAQLAQELVALWPADILTRVFFSDDGSTAIEVALKMALQFWRQSGRSERRAFVAFRDAYHGDTLGAASLGGIGLFQGEFKHGLEVRTVATFDELTKTDGNDVAAVIIEPLIQGAAGMRLWPVGLLRDLRRWCDERGVLLILDEVMTGFGRTGTMFACEQEVVVPDFIALAKGLTGGYLPLAATLTTDRVFNAFLGGPERALYYGHSYTANQLGCAAALASLAIFRDEAVLDSLREKIARLTALLATLSVQPHVADVRQCGFIAGIELGREDRTPFSAHERIGTRVCLAARKHGLLTRPIRDTIVLMPPYCITDDQLAQSVEAIAKAVAGVCQTTGD